MNTYNENTKKDLLKDLDNKLAEKFLADIAACKAKGEWRPCFSRVMPFNPITKRYYSGLNVAELCYLSEITENSENMFATFNQLKGAGVRLVDAKGQGKFIHFFGRIAKEEKYKDDKVYPWDAVIFEKNGDKYVKYNFVFLKHYFVFDTKNTNGDFKRPEIKKISGKNLALLITDLYQELGAKVEIKLIGGGNPHYSPSENKIILPKCEQVTNINGYNICAVHELAHWTADNIPELKRNNKNYAKSITARAFEEMIADFAAAFFCNRTGITWDYNAELDYLDGWAEAVKKNPELVRKAASLGMKISEYFYSKIANILNVKFDIPLIGVEPDNLLPLEPETKAPKTIKAVKIEKVTKAKKETKTNNDAKTRHYISTLVKVYKVTKEPKIRYLIKDALKGNCDLFDFQ